MSISKNVPDDADTAGAQNHCFRENRMKVRQRDT